MKFKTSALPEPSKGFRTVRNAVNEDGSIETGKLVVPDQSMSLKEIIERFTRNEAVPVGRDVNYHESDDDLEKVAKADLVDREEFVQKLKQQQVDFDKQEKRKAAAAEKAAREAAIAREAAKLAAEKEKGSENPTAK